VRTAVAVVNVIACARIIIVVVPTEGRPKAAIAEAAVVAAAVIGRAVIAGTVIRAAIALTGTIIRRAVGETEVSISATAERQRSGSYERNIGNTHVTPVRQRGR